jgi:hypothetical protein
MQGGDERDDLIETICIVQTANNMRSPALVMVGSHGGSPADLHNSPEQFFTRSCHRVSVRYSPRVSVTAVAVNPKGVHSLQEVSCRRILTMHATLRRNDQRPKFNRMEGVQPVG